MTPRPMKLTDEMAGRLYTRLRDVNPYLPPADRVTVNPVVITLTPDGLTTVTLEILLEQLPSGWTDESPGGSP